MSAWRLWLAAACLVTGLANASLTGNSACKWIGIAGAGCALAAHQSRERFRGDAGS